MKKTLGRVERFRVSFGPLASDRSAGRNGAFLIPPKTVGRDGFPEPLKVICSDGADWPAEMGETPWEHVSASWPDRCPTWLEMCRVKDLFFDEGETVLQFHPSKRSYVNVHEFCLHLWRPCDGGFPVPPTCAVGPIASRIR